MIVLFVEFFLLNSSFQVMDFIFKAIVWKDKRKKQPRGFFDWATFVLDYQYQVLHSFLYCFNTHMVLKLSWANLFLWNLDLRFYWYFRFFYTLKAELLSCGQLNNTEPITICRIIFRLAWRLLPSQYQIEPWINVGK